jgi:fibronectin-binding autotransporter adhesin
LRRLITLLFVLLAAFPALAQTPTFQSLTVTNGGSLSGTFAGNTTFSGNPTFTGTASFNGAVNIPNGPTTISSITVTNGVTASGGTVNLGTDPNGNIRLGSTSVAKTPFIDFNSTGTATNGFRIVSNGANSLALLLGTGASVGTFSSTGLAISGAISATTASTFSGGFTSNQASIFNAGVTIAAGGSMAGTFTGNPTFSGTPIFSTAVTTSTNVKIGTNNTSITPSTGQDGASFTTANLSINSFNGVGIASAINNQKIPYGLYGAYWNARTGDYTILGNLKAAGNIWVSGSKISTSGATVTFDTGGYFAALTTSTPTTGGANANVNDRFYDAVGNIFTATAVSSGVVTTMTLDVANSIFFTPPANPTTVTAVSPSTATGVTVDLTWTKAVNLTLNPSGPTTVSGALTANNGGTLGGTFAGNHTYSGALTLSSAGTALTVTNSASVGGALTVTNTSQFNNSITVGTNTASANIVLNGQAGSYRTLKYNTAGAARITMATNTTAEGGSNAGSDLDFITYDDAGSVLINPAVRITRATGLVTMNQGATINNGGTFNGTFAGNPTFSGALTLTGAGTTLAVNSSATIGGNFTVTGVSNFTAALTSGTNAASSWIIANGPAGSSRTIRWTTASVTRAQFTLNPTAESGSNAGSDLDLIMFDDAGAAIFNPAMRITRATGLVAITQGAQVAKGIIVTPVAVASLPACAAGTKGMIDAVTDALSPAWNATVAGGGAVSVPVYCNGSAWTVH